MQHLSRDELNLPKNTETLTTINRWLARGDGVAVYENQDMSDINCGDRQFISYGSSAAQLETEEPPEQLPDIGGQINWRYRLVGVFRESTL